MARRPRTVTKFLASGLLAAALFSCAAAARADQMAQVGRPAPAFAATDLSGKKVLLHQFAGHALFVNFFATWCPPCKLELPGIVRRYPSYKDRVVFLGLDQEETPDLIAPFLRRFAIPYDIAIDQGQVAAVYGVSTLPESVFIDRHGIVQAIWRGYLPPARFEKYMALIAGR